MPRLHSLIAVVLLLLSGHLAATRVLAQPTVGTAGALESFPGDNLHLTGTLIPPPPDVNPDDLSRLLGQNKVDTAVPKPLLKSEFLLDDSGAKYLTFITDGTKFTDPLKSGEWLDLHIYKLGTVTLLDGSIITIGNLVEVREPEEGTNTAGSNSKQTKRQNEHPKDQKQQDQTTPPSIAGIDPGVKGTPSGPPPDLIQVVKTGPTEASFGEQVTYIVTILNISREQIQIIQAKDTFTPLGDGAVFLPGSSSPGCVLQAGPPERTEGVIECVPLQVGVKPVLGPGQSLTLRLTFLIPSDFQTHSAPPSPRIDDRMTIFAEETSELRFADAKTATASTLVKPPQAEMKLTVDGPAEVDAPSSPTYRVTLTNTGNRLLSPELDANSPGGTIFADVTRPECGLFVNGSGFLCDDLPDLRPGESLTIDVTIAVPANFSGANPFVLAVTAKAKPAADVVATKFTTVKPSQPAPGLTVNIDDATSPENQAGFVSSEIAFAVRLVGGSPSPNAVGNAIGRPQAATPVSVQVSTSNGSAVGGASCGSNRDFISATNQTVTIPAGQNSTTFGVLLCPDTLVEGPETFTATLSNPTGGATIGRGTATGTITDDDTVTPSGPTVNLPASIVVTEGNSGSKIFGIDVTLSAPSPTPISFDFQYEDGTAVSPVNGVCSPGDDYGNKAVIAPFTIPANQTGPFTFFGRVCGDTVKEPDETYTFNIFGITPNAVPGNVKTTITIQNDDP